MQKHHKKKLLLAAETVRNLRAAQLRDVIGGAGGDPTYPGSSTCNSGGKVTCICYDEY